jgi:RepB DNA-primase from phage plasmid
MTLPSMPSSEMKVEGFEPAVVVETSPNNCQAWLNHGQVLEATRSTCAAKQLAERFGGDPSSADWRHFGRLAGFTNPKPERQLSSGMRPFARLRSTKGRVYSQAAEFIARISEDEQHRRETMKGEPPHGRKRQDKGRVEVKAIEEFHDDAVYAGDLHRADMAWSRRAADMGLSASEIRAAIMEARNLAKKGSDRRQREYAERTAGKAIRQAE